MSEHAAPGQVPTETPATSQHILEACGRAVDRYRDGSIGKAQAVLDIATQLVSVGDQQPGGADDGAPIHSYLAMLDEVDRRRRPGPRSGEEITGEQAQQPEAAERERTPSARTSGSVESSERDRSRAPSEESDSPRSKRVKVDATKYAWAASDFLLENTLHPHIARTLELIRIYGDDLTQARRDLSASPSVPEFPEAEWTNVLAGRPVDLDHVFAGRYSSGSDEKVTERIGELEFSYRAPTPAKKVGCFGDWVYAWKRASVATAFAFPHRRDELDAYGEHIIGIFGALAPAIHSRVLDFDRAVRKRVGSSRRFLLTDTNAFADLRMQYIDAGGANVYGAEAPSASAVGGGRRGKGTSRKKEACRRYNSDNGCPNKASECRFQHVCSGCGADKHTQRECTKSSQRGA